MKWLIHNAYQCNGCLYGAFLRDVIIPRSINNTFKQKSNKFSFLFKNDENRKMFIKMLGSHLIKNNKIYKTYNSTFTNKKRDYDSEGIIFRKDYYVLLKNPATDDIIKNIHYLIISKEDYRLELSFDSLEILKKYIEDAKNKLETSIESNILAYIKIQTKYKDSEFPFYNKDLKFDIDQLTCVYNGNNFIFSDHSLVTKIYKKEATMSKIYLNKWFWTCILFTSEKLIKKLRKLLNNNWDIILPNSNRINILSLKKYSLETILNYSKNLDN
jgi:hypothetical protein